MPRRYDRLQSSGKISLQGGKKYCHRCQGVSRFSRRLRSSSQSFCLVRLRLVRLLFVRAHGLFKSFDPLFDSSSAQFHRHASDDEQAGALAQGCDHFESVVLERLAAVDQIDDMAGKSERGRELDRSVQLDAFGLHALACKISSGQVRILRGDADVRGLWQPLVVCVGAMRGRGEAEATGSYFQVQRNVQVFAARLVEDIASDDPEVCRAECHQRCDIEGANAQDRQILLFVCEQQLSALFEVLRVRQAEPLQQWRERLLDASARQC